MGEPRKVAAPAFAGRNDHRPFLFSPWGGFVPGCRRRKSAGSNGVGLRPSDGLDRLTDGTSPASHVLI